MSPDEMRCPATPRFAAASPTPRFLGRWERYQIDDRGPQKGSHRAVSAVDLSPRLARMGAMGWSAPGNHAQRPVVKELREVQPVRVAALKDALANSAIGTDEAVCHILTTALWDARAEELTERHRRESVDGWISP